MVERHWEDLRNEEVRHGDERWTLTGDVDVRKSGDVLAVEATQAGDVRHGTATLYFDIDDPPDSLNPGALGEHFDRIERTQRHQYLVVKTEGRTYRYELQRLEHE
ncbi:MAG: hypothetical protein ABEJ61_01105 [Haloferacaceae archaeon]